MWRVVFRDPYDRVMDRSPNCIWHPTRARAQHWAAFFTQRGFTVAVETLAVQPTARLERAAAEMPGWDDR